MTRFYKSLLAQTPILVAKRVFDEVSAVRTIFANVTKFSFNEISIENNNNNIIANSSTKLIISINDIH